MNGVVTKKVPKFYKVHVVMKTDFKYSFVCIGRNLDSMLKQVNSFFWTESTKHEEITEQEYRDFYNVSLEEEKKEKPKRKKKK
jgi:hypothetical protein